MDLLHYLTNNTRQLRHTGTQAALGSAHPRDERHTGTQAVLGSVYPRDQGHTGTQALLGSVYPRDQRHTGTQAVLGSVHPKRLIACAVYHKAVFLCSLSQQEAEACLLECYLYTGILLLQAGRR